jgi:hypothetical protein
MTADDRGVRAWFLAVVIVGGSLVALLNWLLHEPAKPATVVYGDSLTVQAEDAARTFNRGSGYRLIFRARAGTAMCDWVNRAAVDHVVLHPKRVVLAFTGNTATCAREAFERGGVAGATALYETSLRQMRAAFPTELVTVLIPPATHNLPNGWFPYNGNPALVAMYERVGRELHMDINTDADQWLTPNHVYRAQGPAFPHGGTGSTGGTVDLRLSDGVHLTPEGALYYGAALLETHSGAVPLSSSEFSSAESRMSSIAPGRPNR